MFFVSAARPQAIPATVTGRWRVVKMLPTHSNVQCWGGDAARGLVGATLVYEPHHLSWSAGPARGTYRIAETLSRTLTRKGFEDERKVGLAELGIVAPTVVELDLQHEDADITGATTEIPGDAVLLAGPGRIVISACGVFYSAVRAGSGPAR